MSAELQKFVFSVPVVLIYIYTNLFLLIKKNGFTKTRSLAVILYRMTNGLFGALFCYIWKTN